MGIKNNTMMKKKHFPSISIAILSLTLLISCNYINQTTKYSSDIKDSINLNGSITIQGRLTLIGTNNPPTGVNTVNISNKWVSRNNRTKLKGINQRVYVDKKGYYSITIEKGDTLVLIPNNLFYKTSIPNYTLANLNKNKTINFTLIPDSTNYKKLIQQRSELTERILENLHLIDTDTLLTITGIINNKETMKPLQNIDIVELGVPNTTGSVSHTFTDIQGYFKITVPKNSNIMINGFNLQSRLHFFPTRDTIINLKL